MGKKKQRDPLVQRAWRTVNEIERDTHNMMKGMLSQPWKYARTVVQLDDDLADLKQFNDAIRATVTKQDWNTMSAFTHTAASTFGEDLVQLARWQRHRIVYAVEPTTLQALLNTDWGHTKIPGEVLARIPHPDPIVALPNPIRHLNDQQQWETYEAFGVFGVRPPRRRASTTNPDISHIALHFFGRITNEEGQPILAPMPDLTGKSTLTRHVPQIVGCRSVINIHIDQTMQERENEALTDMLSGGPLALSGFPTLEAARDNIGELTRTGLAILTYLSSDNRDITRQGLIKTRTKNTDQKNHTYTPDTHMFGIGFKVGASLRAAAKTTTATQAAGGSPTRTVTPHVRRAHLHTFRRGPGRQERFTKWLPPIVVKGEDTAKRDTMQIHRVD